MMRIRGLLIGSVVVTFAAATAMTQQASGDVKAFGRELLKELIETNTTHSTGNVTIASERMAARLLAAGFPKADVQIVGGAEKKRNLVARYRGQGTRKPVLFIAHLDVVEARREDWSVDPFVLTEKDGFFYGRGTLDVKSSAATLVSAFVRLKQENWTPDRDLILALTADEEGGPDNGVDWLLRNRRDLIDAEFSINADTGGGEVRNGKVTAVDVQASEKVYGSFRLTVKNAGGHSSLPVKDNAIYRLAAGLQRLAAFEFPVRLTDVTRTYFERMAPLSAADAADMRAVAKEPPDAAAAARLSAKSAFYNALLRTTCVATMLQGGHAENALPQTAQATVNCRMLPATSPQRSRARSSASRPTARLTSRRSARRSQARRHRSRPKSSPRSKRRPAPFTLRERTRGRQSRSCRSWKPGRRMDCFFAMRGFPSTASPACPTIRMTCAPTARTSASS